MPFGYKSMPFGCMSLARLGAKYAVVGCKSMDTFGCMYAAFGCMSMARLGAKYAEVGCKLDGYFWVHVYAFWVHVYGSVGCMYAVVGCIVCGCWVHASQYVALHDCR